MTEPAAQNSAAPALAQLAQWQRVSPIALVYFCLRLVKGLFGNIGVLAPSLIVFYQGIQRSPSYFLLGLLGWLLLLSVFGLFSYLAFRFRVTADAVEIHSGVFRKKQLNLPFSRIQNVRLLQPLYYRPTGHLSVQLDTAGSSQQEAQLAALPQLLAEQLQHAIYASKAPDSAVEATAELKVQAAESEQATEPEQLLCKRTVPDLILYGISNNRVVLTLGLLAPFYNKITSALNTQLQQLGIDIATWFDPTAQSWFWVGLTVLVVALLVMLVITLFSIALSVLSYYQFRLVRQKNRYIRRSGLFTRHEISMTRSRLQWIRIQQDWLDKGLGRCNMHYEQVQTPHATAAGHAAESKIMVPALLPTEALTLLTEAYPEQQLTQLSFKPINWRYLLPSLLGLWLPLAIASQWWLRPDQLLLANLSALPLAFLLLLIFWRWRRFGYALDAQYLYVRRGMIGVDYYCVPLHKLQQVSLQQHWFMQRKQLRHLNMVFAAGSLTLPYMPAVDAYAIANYALYQVESSGKSWM